MIYKPDYITLEEIVPPEEFQKYGLRLWNYFDPHVLRAQDLLRKYFGKCTLNNWKWGGALKFRGYRPPSYVLCGALSTHRIFKGLDSHFENVHSDEVREYLIKTNGINGLVTRIEMPTDDKPMSWVHMDTLYTGSDELVTFNP